MTNMELLSPAGDWDALVAAVENGADAVYLGGKALNARRGAGNFDDEALKRAADYLHERGKRMFVTVNTLVKQSEMGQLEDVARSLAQAGADAAIVQDFGVCKALREMLPGLELHASTQMAVHNAQGVEYLKKMGFERVVLARELTYSEIRACAEVGVEIEVFCHGALCVACSGQCLFSSLVGGRSGNRGVCAQPCRLPYRLEGAAKAEGYLLSPKDLMTIDDLARMREAGVSSLKIEGRLKRPEYVAVVTGIYRRALNGERLTQADEEALRQIFNRGGFTRGYGPGMIDGEFISRLRPSHWGSKVGDADARGIRLTAAVRNADAMVIRPRTGEDVPVRFSGGAGERLKNSFGVSGEVIRLVSEDQMAAARESVRETKRTVPVWAKVTLREGETAFAEVTDGEYTARVAGWRLERAERSGADGEKIRAQMMKTGATPYDMREVALDIAGRPFASAAGLNALRRDALAELTRLRCAGKRGCAPQITPRQADTDRPVIAGPRPILISQARSATALQAARAAGADEIVLCPQDARQGHMGAQAAGLSDFFLYLPPVLPASSLKGLYDWARQNATRLRGVYLTNVGQLGLDWPGERRYDFALNIANRAAKEFLGVGDGQYTPSVELSAREIEELGGRRELVVYGRLPLMHLRHCPLNAARHGGAHASCRFCDGAEEGQRLNDAALIDRKRARFPLSRLATDGGCVIDVNNSVPLSMARQIRRLPRAYAWRLIFTDEDDAAVETIVRGFSALRDGGEAAGRLTENITAGHYFRPVE